MPETPRRVRQVVETTAGDTTFESGTGSVGSLADAFRLPVQAGMPDDTAQIEAAYSALSPEEQAILNQLASAQSTPEPDRVQLAPIEVTGRPQQPPAPPQPQGQFIAPQVPGSPYENALEQLGVAYALTPEGTYFPVQVTPGDGPGAGAGGRVKVKTKQTIAPMVEGADTSALDEATRLAMAAEAIRAEQEANINETTARMLQQEQEELQQRIAERQQQLQVQFRELSRFQDELRHREIIPGLVFESAGEAALFSGIAAMAAAMNDDVALGMIDKAIDRSIRAQEVNQAHGRAMSEQGMQLYQHLRSTLGDDMAASQAYRASLLAVAEKQLAASAARAGGAARVAEMGRLFEQLRVEQANAMAIANQRAQAQTVEREFSVSMRNAGQIGMAAQDAQAQSTRNAPRQARRQVQRQNQAGAQVFNNLQEVSEWAKANPDMAPQYVARPQGDKYVLVNRNGVELKAAPVAAITEARNESTVRPFENAPSQNGPLRVRRAMTPGEAYVWNNLSPAERNEVQNFMLGVASLDHAIEQYQELASAGDNWLNTRLPGDEKRAVDAIWGSSLSSAQNQLNSGVLNTTGEIAVLNRLNPEASAWLSTANISDVIEVLRIARRNILRKATDTAAIKGIPLEGAGSATR